MVPFPAPPLGAWPSVGGAPGRARGGRRRGSGRLREPEPHREPFPVDLDRNPAFHQLVRTVVSGRRLDGGGRRGGEDRLVELLFHPLRRVVTGGEVGVRDQDAVRRRRGVDPLDVDLAQGAQHAMPGLVPVGGPHHELADEVVVVLGDGVALFVAGVPTHPRTPGTRRRVIVPGEGRNPRDGSSALMRHSIEWPSSLHRLLGEGQGLAVRDAELLGDEVEARHHLGHAVLDLQAGVHLQEPEVAVLVEHLDGPGVDVPAAERDLHRRGAHRRAGGVVETRGGGLLDELLVAALRRAVAFAEPDAVAVGVAEDLHLDVSRPGEVPLEVRLGPTEVRRRLPGGGLERRLRAVGVADDLQALPATSVRGLDRHRPAVLLTEGDDLVDVGDHLGRPGDRLDARRGRGLA